MTEYLVEWRINIEADSPEEAARKALTIQRNPESWATVFAVKGDFGAEHHIDLTAIDEGKTTEDLIDEADS